jgi:hypothetical protein
MAKIRHNYKKKKRCFQWMIATFGYKQKKSLKKTLGDTLLKRVAGQRETEREVPHRSARKREKTKGVLLQQQRRALESSAFEGDFCVLGGLIMSRSICIDLANQNAFQ